MFSYKLVEIMEIPGGCFHIALISQIPMYKNNVIIFSVELMIPNTTTMCHLLISPQGKRVPYIVESEVLFCHQVGWLSSVSLPGFAAISPGWFHSQYIKVNSKIRDNRILQRFCYPGHRIWYRLPVHTILTIGTGLQVHCLSICYSMGTWNFQLGQDWSGQSWAGQETYLFFQPNREISLTENFLFILRLRGNCLKMKPVTA